MPPRLTPPDDPAPVMLFDGLCNLCDGAVNFIIDRDPAGRVRFAANQSPAGRALLRRYRLEPAGGAVMGTVVLVERGRAYTKSSAVLRVARQLRRPWPLLAWLVVIPPGVRDSAYDAVARNRYRWFGRRQTCRVPTPELKARFLADPPDARPGS